MSIDTEAGEHTGAVSAEMADHLARAANALAPQLADVELARARLGTELFPEQRQVATLGRYVLLERIGAGAMGVVYAAYDPELDRKVAVKVLHHVDRDDEQGQRRLLREARALAKLAHPNVVTVHDVGRVEVHRATAEGSDARATVVFLAMEFIDGPTLTRWLLAARPWTEVLAMFLQAARGLAAAHAAGIVHRDFKPDNVLIGGGPDRESRARVTDFGLARALEGAASGEDTGDAIGSPVPSTFDASAITAAGAVVGTPVYMAPEQHLGGEVDARADQFAFCVALWEGLFRHRPFGASSLQALVLAVVEGRVSSPPADSDVPGWLRAVVLRGLAREADARWPTMQELIDALSHDPRRRRRRVALAAGAMGALVLAAGGIEGARRMKVAGCERAGESIAEHWGVEPKAALEHAFTATGVPYATDSFEHTAARLDRWVEDWSRARAEVCLGTTVDEPAALATVRCLEDGERALAELVEQLIAADRRTVALSVHTTTRLRAPTSCNDPVRRKRFLDEPDDPKIRERRAELRERLHESRTLNWLGHPVEAQAAAARVREEIEADPSLVDMLDEALADEGFAADDAGDRETAERVLSAAFDRAARDGDDEGMALLASRLTGLVGDRLDRPAEGLVWARVGEALVERAGAPDSEAALDLLGTRGSVLQRRGDFAEAVTYHQRAVDLIEVRYGSQHPRSVGALTNLGNSQDAAGDHREAVQTHRRALALAEAVLGPWHPDVSRILNNLGNAYEMLGDYSGALAVYERALTIRTAALPPEHPSIANTLSNLGNTLRSLGRYDESLAALERALAIREAALGPGHLDVAMTHGNLGITYDALDQPALALQHHLLSWNAFEAELGPNNPNVATALTNVGRVDVILGAVDEGRARLERALAIFEGSVGGEHSSVVQPLMNLARADVRQQKWTDALRHVDRALAVCERSVGAEHPWMTSILLIRGDALAGAGRRTEAIAAIERAIALCERIKAPQKDLEEARATLAAVTSDAH